MLILIAAALAAAQPASTTADAHAHQQHRQTAPHQTTDCCKEMAKHKSMMDCCKHMAAAHKSCCAHHKTKHSTHSHK